MGLQVSRSVRAQTTKESHFRTNAPIVGRNFPLAGPAEGMPDYRGSPDDLVKSNDSDCTRTLINLNQILREMEPALLAS